MIRVVVLEGDETGQELLEQGLRLLDEELLGIPLVVIELPKASQL